MRANRPPGTDQRPLEFISSEAFNAVASARDGHWKSGGSRWIYHEAAINIVRELGLKGPGNVLEMGTMGVCVVKGSDTIDYAEKWDFSGKNPTYLHDARKMPWPIADKQYALFIALRVYHHLHPVQRECFQEARRIARNVIIVAPEDYPVKELRDTSRGIPRQNFTEWNNGVAPTRVVDFQSWIGNLYFWDETALRQGAEQAALADDH